MGLAAIAIIAVGATMISDPEPAQAQATSINVQAVQGGAHATTDEIRSYSADINWAPNSALAKYRWSIRSYSNGKEVQITPLANLSNSTVSFDVDWSVYGVGGYDVCVYGQIYNSEGRLITEDNSCGSITVEEGEPDSCRVVPLSSSSINAWSFSSGSNNESGSDSEGSSITFSDYTNSDEFVKQVKYTGRVYYSYCAADADCAASAAAFGPGDSLSIPSQATDVTLESIHTESFIYDRLESSTDTEADFTVEATTRNIGGVLNVEAEAEIYNISLSICPVNNSNIPPVAMPDGSVSNPIPVQFETPIYLDVMSDSYSGQDYDPDNGPDTPLVITQATSGFGSSVSVINGGSEIRYNPHNLDYGDTDEITYTISDGADTDTATAYIKIVEKTGTVTVNNPNIPSLIYRPRLEGQALSYRFALGGASHQYTFDITKTPKIFEIPRSHARVLNWFGTTAEFADGEYWIEKNVAIDVTGKNYSAELGRTYTISSVGSNQPPTADYVWIPGPFSSSHDCSEDGYQVSFTDRSSDPDGDMLSYFWSFNEGVGISTSSAPVYNFPGYEPVNGTWETSLTVNDGNGGTHTITQQVPSCQTAVTGG
jgi:hypothetical protein